MTSRGIPHSEQSLEMRPTSASISGSVSAPTLMWTETASAPVLIASSTVATRTLLLLVTPRSVDADRCSMRPMSRPLLL